MGPDYLRPAQYSMLKLVPTVTIPHPRLHGIIKRRELLPIKRVGKTKEREERT
jgi:hypothetical protein